MLCVIYSIGYSVLLSSITDTLKFTQSQDALWSTLVYWKNSQLLSSTISSIICCEQQRGSAQTKVDNGKFVVFGQIKSFIAHTNSTSSSQFAHVGWYQDAVFDHDTGMWYSNPTIIKYCYVFTKDLSPLLVTAIDEWSLWFCNSGKKTFHQWFFHGITQLALNCFRALSCYSNTI